MDIQLSKGFVARIDDEDLSIVSSYVWHPATMGRDRKVTYATTRVQGKTVYMHRLLCPGADEVDHRNCDGLDNRRENLRPATHRLNIANQRPRVGCSSRFKGVSWHKARQRWEAYISTDGRGSKRCLGYFASEEAAARAYNEAALAAWGEFARPNDV